ncbi:MAG TPA: hypothetical protein VFV52_02900 [Bacilli bacterium]|nr:hypothetical protein [Bacilli bacterium]
MPRHDLNDQLTLKEIDDRARYEPLEIAGLSGLAVDKVESLVRDGALPTDEHNRIQGSDFLQWVEINDLPVKQQ